MLGAVRWGLSIFCALVVLTYPLQTSRADNQAEQFVNIQVPAVDEIYVSSSGWLFSATFGEDGSLIEIDPENGGVIAYQTNGANRSIRAKLVTEPPEGMNVYVKIDQGEPILLSYEAETTLLAALLQGTDTFAVSYSIKTDLPIPEGTYDVAVMYVLSEL